jgi:hypothetical protein
MKHASRDSDTTAADRRRRVRGILLDLPDTQSCLPMIERLLPR